MKIIEIKTTQNVVLQYELADLRDRIMAFLIDVVTLLFGLGLLLALLGNVFYGPAMTVLAIALTCIFIFYSLAMEVFNNGQSLGKMAMGIQVIKTTSGRPNFADCAGRWVFRLVDIWFSLGGIAAVLVASSSRSQRIGDIVANTAVVKLSPQTNLTLSDILSIHAQNTYKPDFLQARQLMEDDVLLIKNTLDRHRKYGNEAHDEAIAMLATRIAALLHLAQVPEDSRTFLQTVLKDYVMLTR